MTTMIRECIGKPYYEVESLGIKAKDILYDPKYMEYKWKDKTGVEFFRQQYEFIRYCLKDCLIAKIDDEQKKIWFEDGDFDLRKIIDKKRELVRIHRRKKKAQKYLESPFAKQWLKKMKYTVKEDDEGNKYIFLAILVGHNKISKRAFTNLCTSIYEATHKDRFCMNMWIGGTVNWTMLYSQPFGHVNGHETYFCHGVAEDNYSPDDWERDMEKIRKAKGRPVKQYDFISFLFGGDIN